jgi:AmmeMemoRadiSam system protein B
MPGKTPGPVREPAVAGMFYEWDREALGRTLKTLFSKVKKGPEYEAVVSPHAGYVYSGRTAARAIYSLRPGKRFIILGPNHTGLGSEFSMMASGSWRTPLGPVRIDTGLARALERHGLAEEDGLAHAREHSIEVQLPFLQHRFGRAITFLPLSIMASGYTRPFLEQCKKLGSCLAEIATEHDARIIASSDFSHFISWEAARERDHKAIERIRELDLEGFFRTLQETRASVCGYAPIAVLMAAASRLGWKRVEVLDYTSSGEATGDYGEVVAYAAIGFR